MKNLRKYTSNGSFCRSCGVRFGVPWIFRVLSGICYAWWFVAPLVACKETLWPSLITDLFYPLSMTKQLVHERPNVLLPHYTLLAYKNRRLNGTQCCHGGIKIVALWIMRHYNLLCAYAAEEFIDSTFELEAEAVTFYSDPKLLRDCTLPWLRITECKQKQSSAFSFHGN